MESMARAALNSEHLADLRRSGLSEEIVAVMGVRSLTVDELRERLGYGIKTDSALEIPYPGLDFARYRLFPPASGRDGREIRYLQRKASGVHLYILPSVRDLLGDPSVALYYTEGEKKAAKATQEGFPCVGLGGLWNWLNEGADGGIAELDEIAHVQREEIIVPDSDVWSRDDLKNAVFAFGKELERRGARVSVLPLPGGGKNA